MSQKQLYKKILNKSVYPTKTEYVHDGCIKYKTNVLTTETSVEKKETMYAIQF